MTKPNYDPFDDLPDTFWEEIRGQHGADKQTFAISLAKSLIRHPALSESKRGKMERFLKKTFNKD